MKILDELEHAPNEQLLQFEPHPEEYEYGGYFVATDYVCLVQKALPALIRVARAAKELSANAYRDCEDYYAVETLCMANLEEALQQLRALGEGK